MKRLAQLLALLTVATATTASAQTARVFLSHFDQVSYGDYFLVNLRIQDTQTNFDINAGTVTVRANGAVICTVHLPETIDNRCYPPTALDPGQYVMEATLAAPGYDVATGQSTLTVNPRAAAVAYNGPTSGKVGVPITFAPTLQAGDPDNLLLGTLPPTGTLALLRDGVTVCSTPVAAFETTLDCVLTPASLEPMQLSVQYSGDARYAPVAVPRRLVVFEANTGLEVGDFAPDFEVFDQTGARRTLREFAGKYLMLDFCAAWCPPCQQMGYDTGRIRASFAGQPFEYLTIVMQDPSQEVSGLADAQEWLSEHPVFGPVLHRNGVADPLALSPVAKFYHALFDQDFFPTLVLLDPQQRIVTKTTNVNKVQVAAQLQTIAGAMGLPVPPLAPRQVVAPLTNARLSVTAGGTALVPPSLATGVEGNFQFPAPGMTAEIYHLGTSSKYDDSHVLILGAPSLPVSSPIEIVLDQLAWSDFARDHLPSRVRVFVNGDSRTREGVVVDASGTTLRITMPPLSEMPFFPPLEPGVPVRELMVEFGFDVDFSTRLSPPPPSFGPPASIAVAGGGTQFADRGTVFAQPLVVMVRDAAGRAVPGAQVTFTAPANKASAALAPSTVATNAAGIASATATANGLPGSYEVSATVAGVATPATFQLTNVAAATMLKVKLTGKGSGSVSSTPAGLECGPRCVVQFPAGTVVTLAATAESGSTFAGWTGACSGTATCVVPMNGNQDVEARFEKP